MKIVEIRNNVSTMVGRAKIQKKTGGIVIYIPKYVVEALEIKEGDNILVIIEKVEKQ